MKDNVFIREDLTAPNVGLINRIFNHPNFKVGHSMNGKIYGISEDNFRIQLKLFDDLSLAFANRHRNGTKLQDKPGGPTKPRRTSDRTEFTVFKMDRQM